MKRPSRAVALGAASVVVLAIAVAIVVALAAGASGFSPGERIAQCAAMEARTRCEYLEEKGILCDSGYPFCGSADSADERIFLCGEAAKSYGEPPAYCARLEQAGQLCENGSPEDQDPLVGEPGQCENFEHRTG
jgi:hypothetical protein